MLTNAIEERLRRRRADAAGFEAVGFGVGGGGEADAVFERDGVDPVAVSEVENTQYQISDKRIGARIGRSRWRQSRWRVP